MMRCNLLLVSWGGSCNVLFVPYMAILNDGSNDTLYYRKPHLIVCHLPGARLVSLLCDYHRTTDTCVCRKRVLIVKDV